MPERTLNYDPTTPEGKAIGNLFRACKDIEDSDGRWNGGDTVEVVCDFFIRLGIDIKGDVYQVDPIAPEVIAPPADTANVTRLLIAAGPFVDDGYPTGHEGFFHAEADRDWCAECVLVTFPTAPPALVRVALSWLRQAGYAARQVPANSHTQAAVHVERGALYPQAPGASIAEQATRLLWLGGFTTPTVRPFDVVGTTTPTPVNWRPGWLRIDIVAPRTTGRDDREEAACAAALFTNHGWQIDHRATDILHVTPATP
ncbi:hypothetical protein [Streptomyces sp900116325]|uniref:Uncharacterized protein n=1 Tax=Streptomyces sp. 900116325 TaxID=3154295 RepID=A0ABV2UL05_9ACTN